MFFHVLIPWPRWFVKKELKYSRIPPVCLFLSDLWCSGSGEGAAVVGEGEEVFLWLWCRAKSVEEAKRRENSGQNHPNNGIWDCQIPVFSWVFYTSLRSDTKVTKSLFGGKRENKMEILRESLKIKPEKGHKISYPCALNTWGTNRDRFWWE